MNNNSDYYRDDAAFDALLSAIETLRTDRQRHYRRQHPLGKRFTQQELNDEACSTYKNYLDGRSRRMPSRSTVLAIAEYLEATAAERDHLLRTAGYLPVAFAHTPVVLEQVLIRGRARLRDLQFPSLLVTRDYRVHTVCPNMTTLVGIPAVRDIPADDRNLFAILFDPCLSPRLSADTRLCYQRALVSHFKYRSIAYATQPWYTDLYSTMQADPAFRELWQTVTPNDAASTLAGSATYDGEWMNFGIMLAPVDTDKSVYTVALLPTDDIARAVFERIGCDNTPDLASTCLQWERAYRQMVNHP